MRPHSSSTVLLFATLVGKVNAGFEESGGAVTGRGCAAGAPEGFCVDSDASEEPLDPPPPHPTSKRPIPTHVNL
jgi:hypothetical protein